MTVQAIVERIEKLEIELATLKDEVKQLQPDQPAKTSADLYGIFRDKLDCTDDEIEAAKYKFDIDKYTEKYG